MHGVLELVVAEPVKTEALEGRDPAGRQLGVLLGRGLVVGAAGVVVPGLDAVAAGVAVRVDVDGADPAAEFIVVTATARGTEAAASDTEAAPWRP